MIYNDGVPIDDNYRVKYCPRCKNQEIDTDSEYCQICGLSLYNVCVGNWNDESPEHKNKSNARYCRICGRLTTYFHQNLLISYDKYKEKQISDFEDTEYNRITDIESMTNEVMISNDIQDLEEVVSDEDILF
ncbi:hypothetical protein [Gemella morbillorum]